ncbi:MAG TPA: AsmA-like C-terminal region-containing protein [Urbifossiella sp.]|nr:AsmA-like C-terminal region-containing protein [Urbifossiella sp.]
MMSRTWKFGRLALIVVGAAAVIGLALRVGAGWYLQSAGGRAVVAERLGEAIGLPVEVRELNVGPMSSTIAFRVLDPALSNSPDAEVLSVESASADVSFSELVTGRVQPKEVRLRGVSISLRLDASGKLLTTLPTLPAGQQPAGGGSVPHVVVESAKVTIRQEGRPAFTVSGVSFEVGADGGKVVLSGGVDDPAWERWKLSGEVDRAAETGWADLATDDAPLRLELLRSIPFMPREVWDNAQPAGRGKATIRITVGGAPARDVGYDIRIQPTGAATVALPVADVTIQEVVGVLRVHAGKVEIGGSDGRPAATGKLAGGVVRVAAKYDYAPEPSVADPIVVEVERLAVKDLPEKWGLKNLGGGLPGKLSLESGFLTGRAKVKLVVPAVGETQVFGGGSGDIALPSFLGGKGRIGVTLGGDGRRLNFQLGETTVAPPEKAGAGDGAQSKVVRPLIPRASPRPSPPGGEGEARRAGSVSDRRPTHLDPPPVAHAPGSPGISFTPVSKGDVERVLLAATLLQPPAPKRPDQTPVEATLSLRDIDIAQLIEQLELKIPYKVAGKVTLRAKLGVPLGEANTAASYKLSGTISSPELRFEGLTVQDAAAELHYQNGVLTLGELRAKVPHPGGVGEVKGNAKAAISPAGDATAKLTLTKLPLGPVLAAVPDLGVAGGGVVTGEADFKAPFEKLQDPTAWTASAKLTSDELTVADRTARAVSFAAKIDKGVVTLTDGAATIEGIAVTAAGTLGLTGTFPVDATVKAAGASVTDLRKLVPELKLPVPVEGSLNAEARLTGTLSPTAINSSGRITATDLTLNKSATNHLDVRWELDPERLRITQLKAGLFGGTVDGKLDYPLAADRGGSFDLAFKDFDAAQARAFVPDFPVRVTGAVTGKVAGTIPPAKDGARVGNLDVDLTAPKMTVQGFPAEKLVGKATARNGALEYSLEGHTLGGTFEVKGRYPGAKADPAPKATRGSARLRNLDLSRLGSALGVEGLRPLQGRVDVTFDYDNDLSSGAGRVSIRGLRWGGEATADDLDAVLLLNDGQLELRDLRGYMAGGIIRGRARVKLDDPGRNFLSLTLDRANATKLLAPFGEAGAALQGNVSLVVRGSFGRTARLTGTATLDRGSVGGAGVVGLRVPFEVTAGAAGGRLTVREATALAGAGRTTGAVTVDWGVGAGVQVNGRVQMFDVPVAALAPGLSENSFVGTGRLTGRFDVSGQNVRSAADLKGNLIAVLNGASAQEIPLLRQAVPYLNPVGAGRAFQTGDVRATLSGGVLRVQRLALANPTTQLFADGSITLSNNRLDLDVVAHTGQIGPDVRGLRLLGLRLPTIGPVPVALIQDVTQYLSNRTVRLTISGTVANPAVRVNTGALLREEAVRFFLSRYVLPAGAAGGLFEDNR